MHKFRYKKLSITGYGEIEVRSKKEAAKLETFFSNNPVGSKPTHKLKVKIEGYINNGNVGYHDGTGQPFGMEVTNAVIEDMSFKHKRDKNGRFCK